jgi:hypothetical protein
MPSNIKLANDSPEAVGKSPTASSSDKADSKYIIKLSRAYQDDDETVTELDMSGIEELTGRDIKKAQAIMTRHGNIATVLETNVEFLQLMAAAACGKEVEFIEELNAKDTTRVKNWVSGYFLSIT